MKIIMFSSLKCDFAGHNEDTIDFMYILLDSEMHVKIKKTSNRFRCVGYGVVENLLIKKIFPPI